MLRTTLSEEFQKDYQIFRMVFNAEEANAIGRVKAEIESSGLFCSKNSAVGRIIDSVFSDENFWNQNFEQVLNQITKETLRKKQQENYRFKTESLNFRTEQAFLFEKLRLIVADIISDEESEHSHNRSKTKLLQIVMFYFLKNEAKLLKKIVPFNHRFLTSFLEERNDQLIEEGFKLSDLDDQEEYQEFLKEELQKNPKDLELCSYDSFEVPTSWIEDKEYYKGDQYKYEVDVDKLEKIINQEFKKSKTIVNYLDMVCRFNLQVPTDTRIKNHSNLHNVKKTKIVSSIRPELKQIETKFRFLLNKLYSSTFQRRTIRRALLLHWVYNNSPILKAIEV